MSASAERAGLIPDLVWRVQISGLLLDLTKEVLALTEVVLVMNEKLAENEEKTRPAPPSERS